MSASFNTVKLNTIQKQNKLNTVYAIDEAGNGNAQHLYQILSIGVKENGFKSEEITRIQFQNGARNTEGSKRGVLDVDLLEIVRHRLECFQQGDFRTRENAIALTHIEEALLWMNKRVEDRAERSVLGTNNI